MKARTIILTFSIFISSMGLALAQEKEMKEISPEKRANHLTEKMKEHFNLSDEQTTQVQAANLKMITKKQELKKEAQTQKKGKKGKREAIQKEYSADMKKILNEEQFQKFQKRQQEAQQRRKEELLKKKEKQ